MIAAHITYVSKLKRVQYVNVTRQKKNNTPSLNTSEGFFLDISIHNGYEEVTVLTNRHAYNIRKIIDSQSLS